MHQRRMSKTPLCSAKWELFGCQGLQACLQSSYHWNALRSTRKMYKVAAPLLTYPLDALSLQIRSHSNRKKQVL